MRTVTIVQAAILLAVIAGLAYLVLWSADGFWDWVVFGGIVLGAMGGIIAYHHRRYPPATQKRSFTRDSSSRW